MNDDVAAHKGEVCSRSRVAINQITELELNFLYYDGGISYIQIGQINVGRSNFWFLVSLRLYLSLHSIILYNYNHLVGGAKLHDFSRRSIKKTWYSILFAFWFTYTKIVQLGAPTSGYFAFHTAVELTVRKAIICR